MSEKILATVAADDFIGRSVEVKDILRHAGEKSGKPAFLILSEPSAGASEILKQVYDRLFYSHSDLIPVYFTVKASDKTAKNCAARFLQTLLAQINASRHRNPQILNISPDVYELADLAAPDDKNWIAPLIRNLEREGKLNDQLAFVKNCLNAPLRANVSGARIFLMIDALDEAADFSGATDFVAQIKEMLARLDTPFVVVGKRRFLLDALSGGDSIANDAKILRVEPLEFSAAKNLIENLAGKFDIEINEQTRDLIARQTNGKPLFIKFLIDAAREKKARLDSFQTVEKIYADEIFGGRLKRFYDALFRKISGDFDAQKAIIEILYSLQNRREQNGAFEFLKQKINSSGEDFYRTIDALHVHEIANRVAGGIEPMSENVVLNDYLAARFRLEIEGENRAAAVGETFVEFIKRAPHLMAKFYRRDYAIRLRELLTAFDSQETPVALLDYSIFKERFKGLEETEISEKIAAENERVNLPQIVYAAHTAAFYAPIKQVVEAERSAIAFGFDERKYTEADETIWIAAEVDSKLEASRETIEFWCDRLEMVALNGNFPKYKLWLVAPEGFADEASEILKQRNAFGSSRRQIDLLAKFLDAENSINKKADANEYEIVVPMGEDTELIAAHTIEDIARRYSFDPKAINQIKTALIEACINATEHSLSPDRKIYQKFTIEPDKITIKISNRGLRIADKQATEFVPDEGRRGWGLKLMQSLMDEVKFEQVDDGTRISMTKYFQKS